MAVLPKDDFYRTNRSTIIRLSLVKALVTDRENGAYIEYASQAHPNIKVPRRRCAPLKKLLKELSGL